MLCVGAGLFGEAFRPLSFDNVLSTPWRIVLGLGMIAAGVALNRWAQAALARYDQSSDHMVKPTRLVTGGPFAWSRNPLYIAILVLGAGFGLLLNGPWVLVMMAPMAVLVRIVLIGPEEQELMALFPQDYAAYRRRVRRWL